MGTLLSDQYARLLDRLPADDPWPTLAQSGFLDLLAPESRGGAAASLEVLFPLVLETGRRAEAPPILETMAARLFAPCAIAVGDVEALVGRPLAAALAAGQMAGAMEAVHALTLEYASTRQQFGRPIGRFQAVQNQIAVQAEEVAAARIAVEAAFRGTPLDVPQRRVAVAKLRCGQAARNVISIAHAIHGAIGISQEYRLHHYSRRLREWGLAHGGVSWWAQRLGEWALMEVGDVTTLVRNL